VVDPEALGEMVRAADNDERIGLVGSKIYYYDRPELLWFAGGGIRARSKLAYHIGAKQHDSELFQTSCEAEFITGCSMLVRTATIREVGPMREEFFLYAEDTDWNIRIGKAGWRIWWAAGSKVWHKVSKGHGEGNPFLNYYCVRNILQYVKLNCPANLPFTLGSLFYTYVIIKLLQRDFSAIKWSILGFKDFLAGRIGKYNPK